MPLCCSCECPGRSFTLHLTGLSSGVLYRTCSKWCTVRMGLEFYVINFVSLNYQDSIEHCGAAVHLREPGGSGPSPRHRPRAEQFTDAPQRIPARLPRRHREFGGHHEGTLHHSHRVPATALPHVLQRAPEQLLVHEALAQIFALCQEACHGHSPASVSFLFGFRVLFSGNTKLQPLFNRLPSVPVAVLTPTCPRKVSTKS